MSQMNYCKFLPELEVNNLYHELGENPDSVLVRVDINVPLSKDGRINRDRYNLRLEHYAYAIDTYSQFAPLVVWAHQGRNDGKDPNFIGLGDHATALDYMTHHASVRYEPSIPGETYLNKRLAKKIRSLDVGDVLVLKNTRDFDFELEFDPNNCPYIPFFKKKCGVVACINDGMPLFHRNNASVTSNPHIAPTYIGNISADELEVQQKIMHDDGKKVMLIGGSKPKFEAIPQLAEKMDIKVGGLTGQLMCRLKGHDLGEINNNYLEKRYENLKSIDMLREAIKKYNIDTPIDFEVAKNGDFNNRTVLGIDELSKTDYVIYDVGPDTIDKYASDIIEERYDWRIRGGPFGVYESGFNNDIELIRKIQGRGFVNLGGDSVEQLQKERLCRPILATGGKILLGGGAHQEGMAGSPYPCIDEIIKVQLTD